MKWKDFKEGGYYGGRAYLCVFILSGGTGGGSDIFG